MTSINGQPMRDIPPELRMTPEDLRQPAFAQRPTRPRPRPPEPLARVTAGRGILVTLLAAVGLAIVLVPLGLRQARRAYSGSEVDRQPSGGVTIFVRRSPSRDLSQDHNGTQTLFRESTSRGPIRGRSDGMVTAASRGSLMHGGHPSFRTEHFDWQRPGDCTEPSFVRRDMPSHIHQLYRMPESRYSPEYPNRCRLFQRLRQRRENLRLYDDSPRFREARDICQSPWERQLP
jgi:hypothetical protein